MKARRARVSPIHGAGRASRRAFASPLVPVLVALVALVVGAVLLFKPGALRALADRPGTTVGATTAVPTTRPPLSAEEERYIRSLWTIHGDVERSATRLSLGQIFYKMNDLGAAELKARVEQALSVYKSAQARIQTLDAPASLRAQHDDYLAAVRLFEESANEIMKMFGDGRDEHLLAAYPKGQAGADKIREIGGKFWPNEFPAH